MAPDQYKFEMLRFDESAQINTALSVKTKGILASEVVAVFADFLQACGFHANTVGDAFQEIGDELSSM